jgi:hypothetical protein
MTGLGFVQYRTEKGVYDKALLPAKLERTREVCEVRAAYD